jgi:anti-anti-sigma regulatory factor
MAIKSSSAGKVRILHPRGPIFHGNRGQEDIEKGMQATLDEGHKRIVVNLEAVPAIDSGGTGTMVRFCYLRAKDKGATVKLVIPKSSPLPMHVQTCLRLLLETFENEAGAVASFGD